MINCPKCGAEYTVLPDICAQCGMHFEPADGIPDPFTAAIRQEQRSREQQQAQREAFLKLRHEKAAQKKSAEPENDTSAAHPVQRAVQPPPGNAPLPETPASDLTEPETPRTHTAERSASAPKKKNNKPLILLVIAALIGLFVYAGFSLRDGFINPRHAGSSSAVYRKDSALWLYQEQTGTPLLLTEYGEPKSDLPQDYFEKLIQFSADGRRIWFPSNFSDGNLCEIVTMSPDDSQKKEQVAGIRMYPSVRPEIRDREQGNTAEDYAFTDMLPPYITEGDTVFYINQGGALCRKRTGAEPEIISDKVVRYWHVEGKEGVFYLEMQDPQDPNASLPEEVQVNPTRWSCVEAVNAPCQLGYCGVDGAAEMPLHHFEEMQIMAWNVSPADSSRYFYFLHFATTPSGDIATHLYQADLVQGINERITGVGIAYNTSRMVVSSYPDGSFYYAEYTTPSNASDLMVSVHFFDRKQDKSYSLQISRLEDFLSNTDFCRTAPYFAYTYNSVAMPYVYYQGQQISVRLPDDDDTVFLPRVPRFDAQYPVLYLQESPAFTLSYENASSSGVSGQDHADEFVVEIPDDSHAVITSGQSDDASGKQNQVLCYAVADKDKTMNFQKVPYENQKGQYFAFQPSGANQPLLFCWEPESGEFAMPKGRDGLIADVLRTKDSLFCFSDLDRELKVFRDGQLVNITDKNMQPDQWMPVAADTAYALNMENALSLCLPEGIYPVDTADQLCAVWNPVSKPDEYSGEVSE